MRPRITSAGLGVLMGALEGKGVNFTKIVAGNGALPGDYRELTDLANPLLTVSLDALEAQGEYVLLTGTLNNSELETGFYWTETGIFCSGAEGEDDILYAYGHCQMESENQGAAAYIPRSGTEVFEVQIDYRIYVGEMEDITATLGESAAYATRAALAAHTENTGNPHRTTPEQIGLGNVPNVATNDQTPTYAAISAPTALVSGERLSAAFGKLSAAVSALISHLSARGNPHGTSLADLGAAAASHTHSAADINAGILGTARGGTGVTSLSELKKSLKAFYCARLVVGTTRSGWTDADCDYLCNGTDDQVKINAALAALPSSGGCVYILDGTYQITGNINMTKANTELRGSRGVVLSITHNVYLSITANSCTLRDLTLTGTHPSSANNDTYPNLRAVNCSDLELTGIKTNFAPLRLENCSWARVHNNNLNSSSYAPSIYLTGGGNNSLSDNLINGGWQNVDCRNETSLSITGTITQYHNQDAIYLSGCVDVVISGNVLNTDRGGISQGVEAIGCSNLTISGNRLSVTGVGSGQCILISGTSENVVIVGNSTTNGDSYAGISVGNTKGAVITGNVCKTGHSAGVTVSSSATNVVNENNALIPLS